MLNVLIPTSGVGSRLGELTKYTNKSLVRVGDKPALTRIIEQYPEDAFFFIMLGDHGELVREYLSLAHPDQNFVFLDLEMREGNMGLMAALRAQRHLIEGPFIFHASDTLVTVPRDFIEAGGTANIVLGYPLSGDNSQYRTIRPTSGGCVERILEKGEINSPGDMVHIGVVNFRDPANFWKAAETLDDYACDTHVVNAMLAYDTFRLQETDDWWDVGNIAKLQAARSIFANSECVVLEKPDQAVYFVGDQVIKFFSEPEMTRKRVERAKLMGDAVPKIFGSTEHFFAYQRAEGQLARDVLGAKRFREFLNWCQYRIWCADAPVEAPDFETEARSFYKQKTYDRIDQFYAKTGIRDESDEFNGWRETVPKLEVLLERVPWKEICNGVPRRGFHGDLHFSNILVPFKLLDWREDFAGQTRYGDVYYDLAKLLHGLIVSHDLVEKNFFTIEEKPGTVRRINLDILRHNRHVECERVLMEWSASRGYDVKRIRILCALIYLNIAALHHHPYDRFLYFLGKKMLAEELA